MAASSSPATARRPGALRSPVTWVIILGVALAGGAYLLYRRNQASQAAASTATTGTAAASDQVDYSGQIATLQTEIADLQSSVAQMAGSGGGTTGSGTPLNGGNPPHAGGTGTTIPPPKTGGTTPPPPSPTVSRPGMPTGVKGSAASSTTIRLSWSKVPAATSYSAHATYQGRDTGRATTSGTSVTLTGLTPDHTYTCHVIAINSAGESPETNGPVVKTPRG